MSSWRSSNIDVMVLAAFAEKGPLPSKEEAHWMVLSIDGFVVVREAFIGMDPYGASSSESSSDESCWWGSCPGLDRWGASPL